MSSLQFLNKLALDNGVQAAYYDKPADLIIEWVESGLNIARNVISSFEGKLYNTIPNIMINIDKILNNNISLISRKLPLMRFSEVLLFVIFYLSMVFFGRLISNFYSRMEVKSFSLFHNFCMVALSGYMCTSIVLQAWNDNYVLFGNPANHTPNGIPMAKIIWIFYISKIPEFVDTLIMLLKKNYRQISFLHVYHHGSIFVIWWIVTLMAPSGDAYFSAALNSFIHVIMYGYYLLSSLGFKSVSFIKKYITLAQMTQFSLNFIQATYNIIDGYYLRPHLVNTKFTYPLSLSILLWVYMISMLALFANFFIQDRIRQASLKKSQPKLKKVD